MESCNNCKNRKYCRLKDLANNEQQKQLANECARYNPEKLTCKYCGEFTDSIDPDVLCADCRECFGHTFIHEL